ncbi:hypothetical protein BS614_30815 (plasmid) [Paenibacillus xylanexedens]|uniref:DNA-binding protein n=1 Tax=Paenibacillus xylanexedens TaxID=528191 RepID=UPI0009383F4B|nr:DNA-binding protein [Paenibacillus xylanexedens]APO48516.1 hypothetical protein BS614_30815 [Paenibacillus xylanexedens]
MEKSSKGVVEEMAEKLTKETIFAVADAISAEGKAVRVAEVHRRLGYGSLSTITPAVREWREQQKPAAPVEPAVVPQVVADRLTALGMELWVQAQAVAEEGLRKEREALEAYRSEIEDQQQETAEYADALNDANEVLKERYAEQKSQLEALRVEKESLANQLKTTSDQLIAAQTREQSIGEHLKDLRELLAEREAERDSTTQTARQQAEEISRLREELAVIKEREKIAEQQLVKERADTKELQGFTEQRLADERAAREQVQQDLEVCREKQQAAEVKTAKLEGEITALRAQGTTKKPGTKAKPDGQ